MFFSKVKFFIVWCISFDSSKVKSIRFYTQPEGKIYPVREFPDAEKHLSGLDWNPEGKPLIETFTDRKKPRVKNDLAPVKPLIKPKVKKTSKKKK